MNNILQYLKANQGHPIYREDIYNIFNVKSPQDSVKVDKELNSLISKGLIYPYNNGFYLTRLAESKLTSPLQTTPASNPYSVVRKRQQGITYENRDQYLKAWSNHFIESLNQFKKNHPELSNLFDIVSAKTAEDLGRFHDPTEFAKDVQAIFNKFNFDLPELRFAPQEKSYTVPEMLNSIEHAIAESVSRLGQYSSRHKSYMVDSKKYREIFDRVNEALDDLSISTIFMKELNLTRGSFIKRKTIEEKLTSYISKTYNIKDTSLIKISLNQVDSKIIGILQSLSSLVFFEGEGNEEISNRLYNLLQKGDENFELLYNFNTTCPKDLATSIGQALFSNKEYENINFAATKFPENITISNCNFTGTDLRNTEWKGIKVLNNNFANADFSSAKLTEVVEFRNNNIENTNFQKAFLSPEIDLDVNQGTPINFVSLKLSKEEMEEKGFKKDESFDHTGLNLSLSKTIPGRGLDIKGESWTKYIQASPTAPFPSRLYDIFNLHKIPLQRFLGWVGGKYDEESKILYITKARSDLLQKTFELSKYFLDKAEKSNKEVFHGDLTLKNLREFSEYKNSLEQYFKGWPRVFMNQAVREAKIRGAEYVAVPVDTSPHGIYNKLVDNNYPYEIKNNWYIIPVNSITKFAKIEKLSWKNLKGYYENEKDLDFSDEFLNFENNYDIIENIPLTKTQKRQVEKIYGEEHVEGTGYYTILKFCEVNSDLEILYDIIKRVRGERSLLFESSQKLSWADMYLGRDWLHINSLVEEEYGYSDADQYSQEFEEYIKEHLNIDVDDLSDINYADLLGQYLDDKHNVISKKLSWWQEYEEPLEEHPQEEVIVPSLKFDMDYEKEKENMINQYLDKLFKAKKENNQNEVEQIKQKLDELVSLGSKLSWQIATPVQTVIELIDTRIIPKLKEDINKEQDEELKRVYQRDENDYIHVLSLLKKGDIKTARAVYRDMDTAARDYLFEDLTFEEAKYIKKVIGVELNENASSWKKLSWQQLEFEVLRNKGAINKINFTSYQGAINTTYDKLLNIFGEPSILGSGDGKVRVTWIMYFPQQQEYITIYDFKDYDILIEEVTDWHIGGYSHKAVDMIQSLIGNIGDVTYWKLSWQEPKLTPLADENHTQEFLEKLNEDETQNFNRFLQDYFSQYLKLVSITSQDAINLVTQQGPAMIDYRGPYNFKYYYIGERDTEYGSVWDIIGERTLDDYEILSAGIVNPLNSTSSKKLGWKDLTDLAGWLVKLIWKKDVFGAGSEFIAFIIYVDPESYEAKAWEGHKYVDNYSRLLTEEEQAQDALNRMKRGENSIMLFLKYYDIIPLRQVIDLNKISSQNLNWNSGKDSYKDLSYNYDKERGQQLNVFEPGRDKDDANNALSPIVMKQPWNTENLTKENDNEKEEKDRSAFDWIGRENLQFGV